MRDAVEQINKLFEYIEKLRPITRDAGDINLLDDMVTSGKNTRMQ